MTLPPRERQVLDRLWAGKTHREIAAELGISPNTVATYIDHLFARFECRNSIQLVRAALQAGLLVPPVSVKNS